MKYRTLWDRVSVTVILRLYPERVETKRNNGPRGTLRAFAKPAGNEWRPLATFSATHLELLETLFAYWRETEVAERGPQISRDQAEV
jgi:hypothetical protein